MSAMLSFTALSQRRDWGGKRTFFQPAQRCLKTNANESQRACAAWLVAPWHLEGTRPLRIEGQSCLPSRDHRALGCLKTGMERSQIATFASVHDPEGSPIELWELSAACALAALLHGYFNNSR